MFWLRLLGGFVVESEQGPVAGRAAQKKRIALLPLLATAPTGRLSRDKLIGLLWPDSDTEHARHQLASSVYELRKALGESAILSVGDDLQLNNENACSDVAGFEAACQGREWERAAALYRGPFLDGFFLDRAAAFDRWAEAERERLASLYAGALQRLAEQAERNGEAEGVIAWRRRLAEHDPFNSRFALQLMQALHSAGDRAGTLQQARVHEALLRTELGLDPDPRVSALAERLRTEAAEERALRPSPPKRWRSRIVAGRRSSNDSLAARVVPRGGRFWAHLGVIIGVPVITAAVALGSSWTMDRSQRRTAFESGESAALAVAVPETQSIAVLPFADLSPGRNHEYFSDGMTDEVINALARIEGLRVAAWTSVLGFKEHNLPVREVARRLEVRHVLEGSVRRTGARARISVRLVDAETGFPLWSETFDRELSDIFAIQQDIARAIVAAFQLELGRVSTTAPGTSDPEAYDLYLQGRYFWNLSSVADAGTQERSLAYYGRAVERDPRFAMAYAGMADAYSHANNAELARAAALKALALDSTLAAGYTAHAYVLAFFDWNWQEAEHQLEHALVLNPGYVLAYLRRANLLAAMGRSDEAIAVIERAVRMEPLSFIVSYNRGLVYYWAGRYDEAVRYLRHTLAMDSTRTDVRRELAHAHYGRGDRAVAAALYRSVGDTTFALLAEGRQEELAVVARRSETHAHDMLPTTQANFFAQLGMHDRAFSALHTAVQSRDRWVPFQLRFPALAPLYADPRFRQLQDEMGLTMPPAS